MAPSLLYRGLQNASSGATISGSVTNGLLQAGNQSQKSSSKIKLAYVVSLPNYNFVKPSFPSDYFKPECVFGGTRC